MFGLDGFDDFIGDNVAVNDGDNYGDDTNYVTNDMDAYLCICALKKATPFKLMAWYRPNFRRSSDI